MAAIPIVQSQVIMGTVTSTYRVLPERALHCETLRTKGCGCEIMSSSGLCLGWQGRREMDESHALGLEEKKSDIRNANHRQANSHTCSKIDID